MQQDEMERRFKNVDRRVDRIEHILPTLATKDDLQAAVEPLATKAELQDTRAELRGAIAEAVEPLATKAELQDTKAELRGAIDESEQRLRTHFDVVTESLRDDIQLIATGVASLSQRGR